MAANDSYYIKKRMSFSLKNANKPESLIRVRSKVGSERFSFYLPAECKILTKHWDSEEGRAIEDVRRNPDLKGNPRLQQILRNINIEIDKTANALIGILEGAKLSGNELTIEEVKIELSKVLRGTKKSQERLPFKDFLSFIDFYATQCKEGRILNSNGRTLADSSIRNYFSTKSILEKYSKDRKVKLLFENIDLEFHADFVKFLNDSEHNRGKYATSVVSKFIKNIKLFMGYAYKNKYTLNDSFRQAEFKAYSSSVDSIYLTTEELESLLRIELPKNEAEARDSFLVSCWTSLRYSDISNLNPNHIFLEEKVIKITTQKTGARVTIPLNSVVMGILAKYDNRMPPVRCNQATNRMIKQICQKAGINTRITVVKASGGVKSEAVYEKWELVTTHTARRSFATNAYKMGIPTLSIMKITGHKTESCFMKYIRFSADENAAELKNHIMFK